MICEICESPMDDRAAQTACGQFVCIDCVHGNSDVELLEKLGLETLDFDMFKDSFELVKPVAGKSYAGFEHEDLPESVWWSDAAQCLIDRGDGDECSATVSNLGTVGLFDHCAAFVYINHYLLEQTANATPDSEELHHIARCFMGVYPWPETDLEEWFYDHHADINENARATAQTIIERFFQ